MSIKQIATIVGSISKDSVNMEIARFMQNRYQKKMAIEILPLNDIPLYNRDIELTPPAIIKRYRQTIREADGLLLITPEYNHSIPGVLKNALDWFSRVDQVFQGKPTMILGATPGGLGTVKAQIHLRQILNSGGLGAYVLPQNELFLSSILSKLDEQKQLVDEPTLSFLDQTVDHFIQWCERFPQNISS